MASSQFTRTIGWKAGVDLTDAQNCGVTLSSGKAAKPAIGADIIGVLTNNPVIGDDAGVMTEQGSLVPGVTANANGIAEMDGLAVDADGKFFTPLQGTDPAGDYKIVAQAMESATAADMLITIMLKSGETVTLT